MSAQLERLSSVITTPGSPLFDRFATSQLVRSSQMVASDPSGQQQLKNTAVACDPFVNEQCQTSQRQGSGVSRIQIIIIAASIAGALTLLLLVAMARHHYQRQPKRKVADRFDSVATTTTTTSGDVEMVRSFDDEPPLPADWTEHIDPATGAMFYYHPPSNTSTWIRPQSTV